MQSLSQVFDGWGGYNLSLVRAIEPRTAEQLAWRPSPAVRSMGQLARHIALGRINWFVRMPAPGSQELSDRIHAWQTDSEGNRHIAEDQMPIDNDPSRLVRWLNDTWEMIDATLKAWTLDDLDVTYRHVYRGKAYAVSRQWTIWRIMAHDIHHGGQIARILAARKIDAPELRALGGHIVEPPLSSGQ
jgi:uncharacterized damage-inducible protein DinB